jgi:hypothetical protein
MPAGPPGAGQAQGHDPGILARLTGQGHGRTRSSRRGGRYGLLLLLLITSYLLTAFSGATLATELQVVLFAGVLLLSLRTSPLPAPWPVVIGAVAAAGIADDQDAEQHDDDRDEGPAGISVPEL